MKKLTYKFIYVGLISLSFVSCKKLSQGLPDNYISTKADSVLIIKTDSLLPPGRSSATSHPILFNSSSEKRIILKSDAYVYVTFLSQGAAWTNSLGYYTYPLSGSSSNANMTILFPNISQSGEGGGLYPGDLVQIGTSIIPKGTVIGLYLVVQGWSNNHMVNGIYTQYTDSIFNINQKIQSILYVEKTTGKIVLGFEDGLNGNPGTDMDCNDIVVTISDSKNPSTVPTAFDLSSVPNL